jgi:hypothetical protein
VTGFPDPSRQSARVTPICQSARGRISCHRIAPFTIRLSPLFNPAHYHAAPTNALFPALRYD